MKIDWNGKKIIRDLAKEVLEISQNPIQKNNQKLWTDKNSLIKCKPLVLCTIPENAWDELIPKPSSGIQDPCLQGIEKELRQRVFRWQHFKDDEVVTNRIYIPINHTVSDWIEDRYRPYSNETGHSAGFVPCINKFSDLKKLKFPELSVNMKDSLIQYEEVHEVLGDLLDIVHGAPYSAGNYHSTLGWGTSFMDVFVEMRGLEQAYIDLCDNAEFVHEAMDFLLKGTLRILDEMEEVNILKLNNNETLVGPGGQGFTKELPGQGFALGHVTTMDLWGYAQTQEFSEVSPDMLEEFVLPYQAKVLDRFGLNYYGCCETNDRKWSIIKKYIPRLRAVSVSPWANHEIAANELKDQYVYSWKPNPSTMIMTFNEKFIREEIRRVFRITKDCHVVVSMRDTETVFGEPDRLSRWIAIAKEAALE